MNSAGPSCLSSAIWGIYHQSAIRRGRVGRARGIWTGWSPSLIGIHDLKRLGRFRNSRSGSIYIVKPKMHGPDEAVFANDLFDAVEDSSGRRHQVKIGLMDEERLLPPICGVHSCRRGRIVFINTVSLDRRRRDPTLRLAPGRWFARAT